MRVTQESRILMLTLVGLCFGVAGSGIAQEPQGARTEIIRGRVSSDSGVPVLDAEIVATMAPNREVFRTSTDSAGTYELRIPDGRGDYLVHVSAPGWRAFRKRVTRAGQDSILVVDVQLASAVQTLAPVQVEAKRERPRYGIGSNRVQTGAAERIGDGIAGALAPGEQGDIAAMAATLPGVGQAAGGFSVLGLDPSHNQVTLNGLAFAGVSLPRGASTTSRVTTSTYDPTRGGFSGAQVAVDLSPGGMFAHRSMYASIDAPPLQYSAASIPGLGDRFKKIDVGLGGTGELAEDRLYYNIAGQVRHQRIDVSSLLDASDDAMQVVGVAPDSIARLRQILATLGLPAVPDGMPHQQTVTEGSLIARIDHKPFETTSYLNSPSTWGFTAYGKYRRSEAVGLTTTVAPSRTSAQETILGVVQGWHAVYWGGANLTDTRMALTLRSDRMVPYLRAPGGSVTIPSILSTGTPSLASLSFGGADPGTKSSDWTWETTSETRFSPRWIPSSHQLKLYAQSRVDRYSRDPLGERFGLFSYSTLEDLEANRPASFSRSFIAPAHTSGMWSGAVALGDQWRRSRTVSLLYGLRLEVNAFAGGSAYNPDAERLLGVRTDHLPSSIHVSPRVGFTWSVVKRGGSEGMSYSNLGSLYSPPRGLISGGVGEFRGSVPASALLDAAANTGLGDGPRQLVCIGSATPIPDWSAYASGASPAPDHCADGSPAYADSAPVVRLFDRQYRPPRSWRANLAWSSALGKLRYSIEGIYSLNLDQPNAVDLNFGAVPQFRLADEGNRPVFVSSTSIVPATGALVPTEARLSPRFGSILGLRSDARSVSRQLGIVLTPAWDFTRLYLRAAYTLGASRARVGGIDGSTLGDPREQAWARGPYDVRHQFLLHAGYQTSALTVTTVTRVSSGTPFTPLVQGDVNGDGHAFNDRAFVFDPATASDPRVADGMRTLMAEAPLAARRCLARQLGGPAGINSCEGPWTASVNAQVTLSKALTGRLLRTGDRARLSLFMANVVGGLDQLLHPQAPRGWGSTALPNPVLATVRGFDPATHRFIYDINPRFGSTSPSHTIARNPFRLTLDLRVDLGRSTGEQQLDRWVRRGRMGDPRPRLNADSLFTRYRRTVLDIYPALFREADSLLLEPRQIEQLRAMHRTYRARMDSLWRELALEFAQLPDNYDVSQAYRRQEDAIDEGWAITWEDAKLLRDVLYPIQMTLLPFPANMVVRWTERPKGVRYYSP